MKSLHNRIFIVVLLLFAFLSFGFLSGVRASFYNQWGDKLYIQKEYKEAVEKYKSAAELEDGYAYYRLFGMYFRGLGVPQDLQMSKAMLEKAVEYNHPSAQVAMGRILLQQGKDTDRAITLLKLAAQQEEVLAYMHLAMAYEKGYGVPKDLAKAREYSNLASAHGMKMNQQRVESKSSNLRETTAAIQSGLKKLGFYNGTVDGMTGPMTRKAISSFQRAYGYEEDVEISPKVLKQIEESLR